MRFYGTIFIILLLVLVGCKDKDKGPTGPETYQVKYHVTGSATWVSIAYETDYGEISQANTSVPWSCSFTGEKGDFVYVSAWNQEDGETVTVTIYKDEEIFKTSTSSGAYVRATASGYL
jgi:hypothetical protein